MRLTPSMQQYVNLKKVYDDCILLFQMGDFYETFFDDAKTISKELNIILTSREKSNPIPMAGFPIKALNSYLPKLVKRGYKVAIANQVEDANTSKGLVKRKVVEIVTPGSLTLDEEKKNGPVYIASVYQAKYGIIVAYTDILSNSINLFVTSNTQNLINELKTLEIKEIVVHERQKNLVKLLSNHFPVWPIEYKVSQKKAKKTLTQIFDKPTLALGLETDEQIVAIHILLNYIEYLKGSIPKQLKNIKIINTKDRMYIDHITLRNLDILPSIKTNISSKTLLETIDYTKTPMGYRKLYLELKKPLTNSALIQNRLDHIQKLLKNTKLIQQNLTILEQIYDLERITGLIGLNKIKPKQVLMLKNSLTSALSLFENNKIIIKKHSNYISNSQNVINLILKYINNVPANELYEGNIINGDTFSDIKELRDLSQNAHQVIENSIQELKNTYNLDKLKLGYNKIYGYYLEIPKSQSKKLPDTFIRKQTLVHTERFITPELKELEQRIITAQEKLLVLEQTYYIEFIDKLKLHINHLIEIYNAIAYIDFITNGAFIAEKYNYTKPIIAKEQTTIIEQGRHPVIETLQESFIPNDISLTSTKQFVILTGPNMGGKSTFIRQIALIQLLAQIGYYVPASKAKLSIKDRIFARVGASDDLSNQMSTFMVEMSEIANILQNATQNSLIILDEVGRGTSTWEGLSLAYAISEYIITQIKAHTLFATHYHELTELATHYSTVVNLKVDIYEEDKNIVFLHTISKGTAQKSYGIHIAQMVDLPQDIIKKAEILLQDLNQRKLPYIQESKPNKKKYTLANQPPLIKLEQNPKITKTIKTLKEIDINNITPIKALQILSTLQDNILK